VSSVIHPKKHCIHLDSSSAVISKLYITKTCCTINNKHSHHKKIRNELSVDTMTKSWGGVEEDIVTTLVHALDDVVDEWDEEGDDDNKYLIDEESCSQILHRAKLDWCSQVQKCLHKKS
jgi:hypothetical protein